jgi:hypothetical protein
MKSAHPCMISAEPCMDSGRTCMKTWRGCAGLARCRMMSWRPSVATARVRLHEGTIRMTRRVPVEQMRSQSQKRQSISLAMRAPCHQRNETCASWRNSLGNRNRAWGWRRIDNAAIVRVGTQAPIVSLGGDSNRREIAHQSTTADLAATTTSPNHHIAIMSMTRGEATVLVR